MSELVERSFPRILPFGEAGLLVEFGNEPDLAVNARVHALARAVEATPPAGLRTLIPAYTSLLLEIDPLSGDLSAAEAFLRQRINRIGGERTTNNRLRTIPTVYGGEFGPDLKSVAALVGLSQAEVVERHVSVEQVVYMIGFSPGFPYIGDIPAELALPRLETPRSRVPAGSVAITGRQTGIYTQSTPGGWRLLGKTPIVMFDPQREPPAYLAAGDRVRFVAIPPEDWEQHRGPAQDW